MTIDTILTTCETLFRPGDVVEIRIPNTRRGTVAGYFDDWNALAREVLPYSGKVESIYVTLNPVNPALLARAANRLKEYQKSTTSDEDITTRRWLLIDFDPIRPSGTSSSDTEHQHALDMARAAYWWLRDQGWRDILAADSGNGAHLIVRIDQPNDGQDGPITQTCHNVLRALGHKFDDDLIQVDRKTFNAARICTLYGTMKCKGDHTTERPHRLSRLLKGSGK